MLQHTRAIPSSLWSLLIRSPAGSSRTWRGPAATRPVFTIMEPTIASKWLELLKEIAPRVNRPLFFCSTRQRAISDIYLNPFKAAAPSFGMERSPAPVPTTHPRSKPSFAAPGSRAQWWPNRMPDGFLKCPCAEIVSLATRHGVPTIYPWRFFAELGGLLSYGNESAAIVSAWCEHMSIASSRGNAAERLPVQPQLSIAGLNLKTAKALGLVCFASSASSGQGN